MNNPTIARRYARALYEEAAQAGTLDAVDNDIDVLRTTLEGSRELTRLFESPVIPRDKKEAVARALFENRLSPITLRFIGLMIENQREDTIPAITTAYASFRDVQRGVVEAQARVASPLSATEETEIRSALERKTNKKVRLAVTVDPAIIGGIIVRVGDTVFDGSVRHSLDSLRDQLEHAAITPAGL